MTEPVMEQALLLDANVPIYALGGEHPQKSVCARVLDRCLTGELRAYASVEMVQEVAHHRLRITGDRGRASRAARDVSTGVVILPFDHEILDLSLDLIERTSVRGRDAVHAATAIAYGIPRIVSLDPAFDRIPGLERLDPADV